jgi:hypothetical protein
VTKTFLGTIQVGATSVEEWLEDSPDLEGMYGMVDFECTPWKIRINANNTPEQTQRARLHERIHVVAHIFCIFEEEGSEELKVRVLEEALSQCGVRVT